VRSQVAQILAHAAAQIQYGSAALDSLKYGLVSGRLGDGGVEKGPLTDTAVEANRPSPFVLENQEHQLVIDAQR
jgi:hypothetical protein